MTDHEIRIAALQIASSNFEKLTLMRGHNHWLSERFKHIEELAELCEDYIRNGPPKERAKLDELRKLNEQKYPSDSLLSRGYSGF